MNTLERSLAELARKVVENNQWRQRQCFNLIPSENTPSLLVKLCEISDPSGRYGEHKTALKKELESLAGSSALKGDQIYYYQGTDFIFAVEERLKREFGRFVNGSHVETRPISGQMANEVVFKATVKFLAGNPEGFPRLGGSGRLTGAMNNHLNYGGHLSAQPFGALFNFVDGEIVHLPLDAANPYKSDTGALLRLVNTHRPPLIVFGKSMFLHQEPVSALRSFLKDIPGYRPIVMYDGSHVLGLLGPRFQDPLAEGADVLTGSTHKTFFGPQRGVIAANIGKDSPLRKFWSEIVARTFPGSTSNHHLGSQLALLAATLEMNQFKDSYQAQVLANARRFSRACAAQGIPVEGGEADGYTRTHQVVIRVAQFGDGKEIAARLQENNIITNFQALPGDETFSRPSGIRMGVQEMTRFGMRESDFVNLARLMGDVILRKKDVVKEVADYRGQFRSMQYCLTVEETLRVAPAILESNFADHDYFLGFAHALRYL
jgi:glycine/serine hydroxymethyltransferase